MIFLALTTSTHRGGAAVDPGESSVAATYTDLHAERVFQSIDEALAAAGVERDRLGAVACDVGPGSFTGVRVGVASAKGIAVALGLPLFGVTSLATMAAAAFGDGLVEASAVALALLDAKKGEIFAAAYDASGACLLEPCHVARADVVALSARAAPGRRVVVIGEVAPDVAPGLPCARGAAVDLPDARWVARLARARWEAPFAAEPPPPGAPPPGDPAAIEPLYVRAPDAKPQTGPMG